MSITLEKFTKSDNKLLKKLYISAFPMEERCPYFIMMNREKRGKSEMLVARDKGEFIGFAYMVCDQKLAYLFYLAVDDSKRGQGYGTKIIEAVKKKYNGMRIFLAREQLDKSAENYAQRVSRRNFYIRCGFEDLPCCIKEGSVVYDVMGIGGIVTAEEYHKLIKPWAGFLLKIVDMRIIEKQVKE
ncbi:MAG: GNAT family N-acetyltransferase [Ruminococcus sp.]|nr:GNAT family N-acetyltransferase [Ruminococcus sp.]